MEPKIEIRPIEEAATYDPQNLNKHSQRGHTRVENSLRRRGANRSVASAGKGVSVPVLTAGNLTYEKAIDAGYKEVVNVYVDGSQLVNVVRTDIEPGSVEAIALGIEDNASQDFVPDVDLLAALAAGDNAVLSALKKEDRVFGGILEGISRATTAEGQDGFDFSGLPQDDRAPFRQMTFTLHDTQAEQVLDALKAAKAMGAFVDSPNENSNGNALARICETFLTEHGNG